jgi:hypothetical protein
MKEVIKNVRKKNRAFEGANKNEDGIDGDDRVCFVDVLSTHPSYFLLRLFFS